ncbi:hypothetical protein FNT36_24420 [Hymenobacter setariae]|uniref:Uncharacterized protein n=1 Tax=Hymenobacter setariae TaxID=2594794 RepID=A0A558BKG3_9BACT|nr:hypothetical protein FNT36_24420 [Hymenobacter setariae]
MRQNYLATPHLVYSKCLFSITRNYEEAHASRSLPVPKCRLPGCQLAKPAATGQGPRARGQPGATSSSARFSGRTRRRRRSGGRRGRRRRAPCRHRPRGRR